MAAYYNEFELKKAAWLRELISRQLIAPGDVDERSIVDVRPDDLRGYTQCHFFAGIGIWAYALRLAGWPDDREVWTGSCPCQPFSAAGKGEAFDDKRHLWPEFIRLIEARRPVACFGEQVSSIDGLAWFDAVSLDLDHADYTYGVLDTFAGGVGAPHRRKRLYWVAYTEHSQRRTEHEEHRNTHGRNGFGRCRDTGRLAEKCCLNVGDEPCYGNASGQGLEERRSDSGDARQERAAVERTGGACGMEDALCAERRPDIGQSNGHRPASGRDESANRAGERSETERMDDTTSARCNGALIGTEGNPRDEARLRVLGERGPVNGFWRSADWVLTRPQRVGDRPGLRPVERGSFPLAHGTSARMGRLRGYGDGIVAQQAAAFIRAYLDTE